MELFAKKSLGQHFLRSPAALAKIIEAARLSTGQTVLEIGPGTGILTEALLASGARVIAVEKDARACELLQQKFAGRDGFSLIQGDILAWDRAEAGLTEGGYAVVANIPYYITGAILESFLEYGPRPDRMVLLVQKEVAERAVARDGKESLLSVSVKAFGAPRIVAPVPRGAFVPPPTVDSAVLAIEDISAERFEAKGIDIKGFFSILKAGFAHKRKYVKRNLERVLPAADIARRWASIGLDEKIRAEDLSLDDWLRIAAPTSS